MPAVLAAGIRFKELSPSVRSDTIGRYYTTIHDIGVGAAFSVGAALAAILFQAQKKSIAAKAAPTGYAYDK
jgi:hypothetical protein